MALVPTGGLVLQQNAAGGGVAFLFLLWFVLTLVVVAGTWKTFSKAGQPGWAAIIPFLNVYVMLKIGGNSGWWLLAYFVPLLNLYAAYRTMKGVANAFGKGLGFTLGLWFLGFVFFPLLGFGDYEYRGTPA